MTLTLEMALVLRDQFRSARARVHEDAEAFREVIVVIERLGLVLTGKNHRLTDLASHFEPLVRASALAVDVPTGFPLYHPDFSTLFHQVREDRNSAVHDGAFARHLASRTVELSLIFEDALQAEAMKILHFMIRDPVIATMWEPLSFVRQKMLTHSFSFLPVRPENGQWMLVSDRALARYLRTGDAKARKDRLNTKLSDAVAGPGGLGLEPAGACSPEEPVDAVAGRIGDQPLLVIEPGGSDRLLGILTAFDLL